MQYHERQRARIAGPTLMLLLGVVLVACGGGNGGTEAATVGSDRVDRDELVIESITTDALAVQAAAPPTTGKADAGQPSGLLAYYRDSRPDKLVVFCHGLHHNVEDHWLQYVLHVARPDIVVVTTNYRDNDQLPILRGAHDTIAATLMAKARFPSVKTVYLLGVSLGGAVSGTALTEAVHATADGKGLYDYWVALEPLSNVFEAWPEAAAALPEAAAGLEEETGGTPLTQPEAYQRRSPALRTADMAAAGLKAVAIVHGVNDGLVTYNQSRELALGLVASGIPVQYHTVLRHAEGQDPGTTGTGTLTDAAGQEEDPFAVFGLAGHADEADATHPVMSTGFELLQQLLDGVYDSTTPYSEGVVDEG